MWDWQPDDFLAAMLAMPSLAVVVADPNDRIAFANDAARALFELTGDGRDSKTLRDLFPVRSTNEPSRIFAPLPAVGPLETVVVSRGREIRVQVTLSRFKSGSQEWRVVLFRNVQPQHERETKLRQAATTDALSGLINRGEFQRILETSVGQPLALAIVDIDHFKSINDCFGHPVGDQMIERIGAILKSVFKDAIAVARLGGDEFGILLVAENRDEFIDRELAHLQNELMVATTDWQGLELTASVGIAVDRSGFATPRALLSTADNAMYESKRGGRNQATIQVLKNGN